MNRDIERRLREMQAEIERLKAIVRDPGRSASGASGGGGNDWFLGVAVDDIAKGAFGDIYLYRGDPGMESAISRGGEYVKYNCFNRWGDVLQSAWCLVKRQNGKWQIVQSECEASGTLPGA